jgi:hypothetical protein
MRYKHRHTIGDRTGDTPQASAKNGTQNVPVRLLFVTVKHRTARENRHRSSPEYLLCGHGLMGERGKMALIVLTRTPALTCCCRCA